MNPMKPNPNTDLLSTLRDIASCAATVLDMFVKLRQDEPHRTEAPTAEPHQAEAPTPTAEPHRTEAPAPADTKAELIRTEAPADTDALVEPRTPLYVTPMVDGAVCGRPQPDVLPDELRDSACELCTMSAALGVGRPRRYETTQSLAQSVFLQLGELGKLTSAALTTDGHRTLPRLDAEVSRLLRAFRERTGPFARDDRGVRA